MPSPTDRKSLKTTLLDRYNTATSAGFNVNDRLRYPTGRAPIDGNEYKYTIDDFKIKGAIGVTEFLDCLEANTSTSPKSKEISMNLNGFSNKKYKP